MKKLLTLKLIDNKPILISDEEIQVDDMVYDTETKSIRKIVGSGATTWSEFRKIEVTSEQIPTNILQAIVSSQLKDGDSVEVEYADYELSHVIMVGSNGKAFYSIPEESKELATTYSLIDMQLNMQYYMEYCQNNDYVTPYEWLTTHKHF